MTKYIATTTAVTIHATDQNFDFGEQSIELRMVDEAGGAFFLISQEDGTPIRAELAELELLVATAKTLLKQKGVTE
jgi:hypothetical protein